MKTFEEAYRDFMKAGAELLEQWEDCNQDNDSKIKNYPKYLPSFDEFLSDMGELLGDKTVS